MQGLTQRIWSLSCNCHVGDHAWQRYIHDDRGWPTALWEDSGEVVAWGWVPRRGHLELLVDPARPDLVGTVLDWFASVATVPKLTVTVTDRQKYVISVLEEHGYAPTEGKAYFSYQTRELADLPEPLLPNGFMARPSTEADLDRRLAVHYATWPESKLSEANYRNVMAAWPYRPDLDWIVESPDGEFVANCLIWLDDHNRVGELEPVGTDPRFRRLGLGPRRVPRRDACRAGGRRRSGRGVSGVRPRASGRHPVVREPGVPAVRPQYHLRQCTALSRRTTGAWMSACWSACLGEAGRDRSGEHVPWPSRPVSFSFPKSIVSSCSSIRQRPGNWTRTIRGRNTLCCSGTRCSTSFSTAWWTVTSTVSSPTRSASTRTIRPIRR
jgi:hypothetical protein